MHTNASERPEYEHIQRLNAIGIALSSQLDHQQLMEMVLNSARELTGADAGSLYIVDPDAKIVRFAVIQNDSLSGDIDVSLEKNLINHTVIPLYNPDGTPNHKTIVASSVLKKTVINIADAYQEEGYDFSGTQNFDKKTGYRSKSFLTVPLCNHENEVIAALQLINKLDAHRQAIPFNAADQEIAQSLASQAAVAMNNQRLISDLHNLFDSFVRVIASAIDAKSPQTGAHCRRVPDATLMLAQAASDSNFPGLEGFSMSDKDMYELKTAAWLHDCGKVVTPHHIVEKSTKLQTISDRIDSVTQRFDILARDITIQKLELQLEATRKNTVPDAQVLDQYDQKLNALAQDQAFLKKANKGGEFMQDADIDHIHLLAKLEWKGMDGQRHSLLNDDEVANLCIRKGTLNPEERQIMEDHMVHTLNMLEQLPFPRHLQQVTEYAVGHHERMDGTGYPRGLTREQLSIPARIMGIADVFEALTAPERSYKHPMSLSQSLAIMGRMVQDQHLDPDLFSVFVHKEVYLAYAHRHLQPEQIDEIDLENLPGLGPNPFLLALSAE